SVTCRRKNGEQKKFIANRPLAKAEKFHFFKGLPGSIEWP
ncbi:MAG: hypothetical protein ACI9HK_005922, partial [Pirellulaceae bacterium]